MVMILSNLMFSFSPNAALQMWENLQMLTLTLIPVYNKKLFWGR
jgi:hypothetical protein